MTKEMYYEICEQLGTEPKQEEIPIEIEDFPADVQEALGLYYLLPANIAEFSGTYLGKDTGQLGFLFDLHEVPKEYRLVYFRLINMFDSEETKLINSKKSSNKGSGQAK